MADYTQFPAGTMAKGINVHVPDFTSDITLDSATINMTSGIQEGIGPRYGMSPIPGHMDQETPAVGFLPGLMRAELGFGAASANTRTNVYGAYQVVIGGPDVAGDTGAVLNTRGTYYYFLLGYNNATYNGKALLDLNFVSTFEAGSIVGQNLNIYNGFHYSGVDEAAASVSLLTEYVQQSTTLATRGVNLANLVDVTAKHFVSSAPFAISGQDIPMQWVVGPTTTVGDGTHAPKVGLTAPISLTGDAGVLGTSYTGYPSTYAYQNFNLTKTTTMVYSLDNTGNQVADYRVIYTPSSTVYVPTFLETASAATSFDATAATTTLLTAGTYANVVAALINDDGMTINSAYKGALVCGKSPFASIFQDWYRDNSGVLSQYIDLVNIPIANIPLGNYVEEGTPKQMGFRYFPAFVRGTALTDPAGIVLLGAANTGLLRSNTVYEFTFSIYDKRLNYETNVYPLVKVQTGATDLVALQIFDSAISGITQATNLAAVSDGVMSYMGTGGDATAPEFHINYLEYRFYYRVEGNTTWIPSLQMDVAQFWYSPHLKKLYLAQNGVGSNIGGTTGGFQDYSTLPSDQYTCAVFYKNRSFWISDKALVFSLSNNILAYPARNSVACPSGTFKGAVIQAYYGQAAQDARLVVFSTNGTYVGKFTGNLLQVPVQLGDGTQANFGLDGSDFVLNAWTSVSAFSFRSAVVGEGILYFWGPTGVWKDDGVNPIQRISVPLEPDLFTSYDPAQTDAIHCIYNDTTKEVWWFYQAATSSGASTSTIIYNVVRETWLYGNIPGFIDASQALNIATGIGTAGSRMLLYARQNSGTSIQRAYFFDQRNRAGDLKPTTEMMVKSFTSPTTSTRRLHLAAGTTAPLSSITAGDTITLQQLAAYTSIASPTDMVALVSAVNSGAGTLDITLPTGVTFDATYTAAGNYQYFPIWQAAGAGASMTAGLNGISYTLSSKYWVPAGMKYWAYWQYLHMLFKANNILPNANVLTTLLGYRTPVSPSNQVDTLGITNNSDNNCQIFHQLTIGNMNAEGQGLRFQLSGVQIGSEWVLQYLEAYTRYIDGMQVKIFEG